MRTTLLAALAAAILLTAAPPALAQSGQELFQQALVKERADGELKQAIALYERIVREFSADRTLTANALVRMGQCYEKLGSTEAERAYQRVVRDFADQTDLVAHAQARLAALQRAAQAAEENDIGTRLTWRDPLSRTGPFAPTPDGRHLVYVDWDVGDLAIRDLASGESRFLTHEATWGDPEQYAWGASVSPDGRTVAYAWAEAGTSSVHVVGIDGSSPRVLHREEGCETWSPEWTRDGDHIVALYACPDSSGMLLISVHDGSARPIAAAASLEQIEKQSVSPDDRFVAVEVARGDRNDGHDIWLIPLEQGDAVPLIREPSDDRLAGWVPGTDDLVFLSDRNGRWDLWSLTVAGGASAGPPRLVRRNVGRPTTGGWSPLGFTRDGTLFYSVYTRWFSLSVAPFDPATGKADENAATSILGSDFTPTWSPNGESLAFVREEERPGGTSLGPYRRPLVVRDLATGVERELASHVQARMPRWSPDGRFILMNGRDESIQSDDYVGGLYKVDVNTGDATPVLELKPETKTPWWYGISGVWARDGTAIIYSQYYGNPMEGRLVWRDLESGRERLLYRDSLLTTRLLAVSPDGNRLVCGVRDSLGGGSFASINNGGRLMMLDLETGTIRQLHAIHEVGGVGSLAWTPDGEYVLFSKTVGTDGRYTGMWRVPADGGKAEELWRFGMGRFAGGFKLSPDGRWVAYETYTQETETWVMENLRTVLQRGR